MTLPLFAIAPLVRRWHQRWGATDAEVAAAMRGDDLVPGCQFVCTRAITIDAPPEAVRPWLRDQPRGIASLGQARQHVDMETDCGWQPHPPGHANAGSLRLGTPADALMSVLLMEFGDSPMIRKMRRGIKQRAERHAALPAPRHEVVL